MAESVKKLAEAVEGVTKESAKATLEAERFRAAVSTKLSDEAIAAERRSRVMGAIIVSAILVTGSLVIAVGKFVFKL